ncbi:capsid protein [Bacillus haynesii]|uniref:phage tail tube protein n=1 Tax=Bacillus haynesii TaxID=1925021 RepID=UPI002281742F|nr:capsid protein [Bacillus haynesii]MCY8345047.1 capsid protein [Bacillus haynesii]MCY8408961.1 capsid protein [Bacillus haynesii]MCY8433490.1 capsid protein [Bacillus haynesii]MCY8557830.1 capsid protein [Bacillus haynesii]
MSGANDFLLNFQHRFDIDISDTPDFENPVYTRMAAGWKSVEISGDENTDDTAYLDGDGGKTTTVMGGMITFSFTGDFDNNNDVHLFLMSKMGKYGIHRVTNFKWTTPPPPGFATGRIFEGPATLSEINPVSGDADAKSEITVTVSFNGNPKIIEPTKTP